MRENVHFLVYIRLIYRLNRFELKSFIAMSDIELKVRSSLEYSKKDFFDLTYACCTVIIINCHLVIVGLFCFAITILVFMTIKSYRTYSRCIFWILNSQLTIARIYIFFWKNCLHFLFIFVTLYNYGPHK